MNAARYYEQGYWQGKYERPYERRRAEVVRAVLGRVPFLPDWLALDLGAGTGFYARMIRERGARVVAADLDTEVLAPLRERGLLAAAADCDFGRLPFREASFDFVSAMDVLEHLREPDPLFDEMRRVLKPGGWALVSTQNRNSLEGFKGRLAAWVLGTEWKAWDDTHRRIYSYRELAFELGRRFEIRECGGYYYGVHTLRGRPLPPWVWGLYTRLPLLRGLAFTPIVVVRKPGGPA